MMILFNQDYKKLKFFDLIKYVMNNSNTLLEFLPIELLSEIILHLEPDYIENVTKVSKLAQSVINSKIFWINKLIINKMNEYIPFMSVINLYSDSLDEYKDFIIIEQNVTNVLGAFKMYGRFIEFKLSK